MSNYFYSFIQLIEERPELFTEEDRDSLKRQQWSDDRDYIDDEIIEWAKHRTSIYQGLMSFSNRNRLPGEGTKLPGDGTKTPIRTINEEECKPLLLNTIHRCLSKSEDKSNSTVVNKSK